MAATMCGTRALKRPDFERRKLTNFLFFAPVRTDKIRVPPVKLRPYFPSAAIVYHKPYYIRCTRVAADIRIGRRVTTVGTERTAVGMTLTVYRARRGGWRTRGAR